MFVKAICRSSDLSWMISCTNIGLLVIFDAPIKIRVDSIKVFMMNDIVCLVKYQRPAICVYI